MKNGDLHFGTDTHHGDSFIGRLDPRAKLLVVVAFLIGGFFSGTLWYSVIGSALFVIGILSAGVALTSLGRPSQSIAILAIITIAFHMFFTSSERSSEWELIGDPGVINALTVGLYYALRLVSFALAALFLSLTTSPVDMAEGIVKACRPLRALRFPVDDLGLILSLAFRFIPILREEMLMIRRAQSLRGVTFTGNYLSRIRNSVPLLVPVFVSAINRADTVAVAIEARGYGQNRKRSYFSRQVFGLSEILFVLAGLAVIVCLLMWSW